jgi:hypothetical protein
VIPEDPKKKPVLRKNRGNSGKWSK